MREPVNMIQMVKDLPARPRGRASVVLTHDFSRQTNWATELAQITHSEHINLLDLFVQDKSLSDKASQFLIPELFDFLKNRSQAPVLIVSELEFLKATWSGRTKVMEQFARQVETWNNSPSLLFVLQYDKILAKYTFQRFRQYTFVVDQRETLAL